MKPSNKRKIAVVILVIAAVGLILYPLLYKQTIQNQVRDYVTALGYPAESIKRIDIEHSYSAKVLGYNEWRISLVFEKEPKLFFWFSSGKGKILYYGVSSDTMLAPEQVIAYSDLFKAGALLD